MNNEEDILLHNDDLEIKVLGSLVSLSQGGNFDDFFSLKIYFIRRQMLLFSVLLLIL